MVDDGTRAVDDAKKFFTIEIDPKLYESLMHGKAMRFHLRDNGSIETKLVGYERARERTRVDNSDDAEEYVVPKEAKKTALSEEHTSAAGSDISDVVAAGAAGTGAAIAASIVTSKKSESPESSMAPDDPKRIGLEYAALFPCIKEHLVIGKEYPTDTSKGVARLLNEDVPFLKNYNTSMDDIIRETLFANDADDNKYPRLESIPLATITDVKQRVERHIRSEPKYLDVVNRMSVADNLLIHWITKGEIGFDFYALRSPDKGGMPFNTLVAIENLAYMAAMAVNIGELSTIHGADKNTPKAILDTIKNTYIDKQLMYFAVVGFGLPAAADAIASGHPIDYIREHYFSMVDRVFEHIPNLPMVGSLKDGVLHEVKSTVGRYADEAGKVVSSLQGLESKVIKKDESGTHEIRTDHEGNPHFLVSWGQKALKDTLKDKMHVLATAGSLTAHLLHSAAISVAMQTEFTTRACYKAGVDYVTSTGYGAKNGGR